MLWQSPSVLLWTYITISVIVCPELSTSILILYYTILLVYYIILYTRLIRRKHKQRLKLTGSNRQLTWSDRVVPCCDLINYTTDKWARAKRWYIGDSWKRLVGRAGRSTTTRNREIFTAVYVGVGRWVVGWGVQGKTHKHAIRVEGREWADHKGGFV